MALLRRSRIALTCGLLVVAVWIVASILVGRVME
jgi:hypothetical protein